jgi:hypothetical protein
MNGGHHVAGVPHSFPLLGNLVIGDGAVHLASICPPERQRARCQIL